MSFEQFYEHLGPRPTPKHSVDRKNNDGNYELGNVRWATKSEQMKNKRKAYHLTSRYRGVGWSRNRWRVVIRDNGLQQYVGAYKTEEEAARAYDCSVLELFGEEAKLNFPSSATSLPSVNIQICNDPIPTDGREFRANG